MNWPMLPISSVCEFAVDCVNKTAPISEFETPYKMIRTTNVKSGFIDLDTVKYVSEATFETWTRRSKPQYGDVILTREAPVGEVGRFTSTDQYVFLGQRLFHYRPDPKKLDWNFLAYVLQSREVQGRLKGMGFGATVEHIKVGDAENLKIPVPPVEIQQRIGNILSAYDDFIENNRRRISLLEESARLLYREWFVYQRFPGHEHVKVVDGMPEGWEVRKLDEFSDEVRVSVKPENISPGTPYIGLEHMPRRSVTLNDWGKSDDIASQKFAYEEGDILFGKIRPYFHKVGFTLTNGVTSSDAIVLRPTEQRLYHYLLLLVSSDPFIGLASQTVKEGSKMPRADWKYLKGQLFPIPPLNLLIELNSICEPIFKQLKSLSLQNLKLREARNFLLPRLTNGEIQV